MEAGYSPLTIEQAYRLRQRGLELPTLKLYEDERVQEIATRQKQLMIEHAELDQKLSRIYKGHLE